ncbi:sugar transferase [Sulfitobacter guttiformis]|uniref:Lipopolysaccharide/colanic/teichoic acid biosynthesis glycosyltransferase n=1 Tax=Sulfitobacter guttiformis TaxID=74349 RepID=A0A420DNX4_9RHOB|nr:sugar transferase [Sulfitobacter guttiformis]KIN73191.1 Bacterial sugar transferase [Sulfitobacter guttiformis KCTC 32187]RKE95869.1 lipopolysaccharide/colanic/teichoic acid biosynthesis glycosyltransferase [Sulfitobacter guttiformis]
MKKFDADQPGYGLRRLASATCDTTVQGMLARASDPFFILPDQTVAPATRPAQIAGSVYRNGGKRLLETVLVVLSLPFFLPIMAVCMIALWVEGGNPFYRQDRLGRNGERFSILKLRTMVRDADAVLEDYLASDPEMRREWDEKQKLIHDPRVTRVGAFLRSSSVDELPQLWNVLTGEMSLIGPRPMMPEQLPMYGNPAHYFALRPGITGLWQISARNENRFSFRNEVDATYNEGLSVAGDVGIIFKTVGVMLRRTGC